jgi:Restriction endonuclease
VTAKEYEAYVARLVQNFEFCRDATVTRNRRFPGVRQPGVYEIDIAVEMFLSEEVFFWMIVECKNHRRRITRPVVQQLAQTRDAISANKAAIASPTGFSKEAEEVAQVFGVALWVMAEDVATMTIMGMQGPYISYWNELYYELRLEYLGLIGIDPAGEAELKVLEADRAEAVPEPLTEGDPERAKRLEGMFGAVRKRTAFYRSIAVGSAVETPKPERLFDPDSVQAQIAEWALAAARDLPVDAEIHQTIDAWRRVARQRIRDEASCDEAAAKTAIERVEAGERRPFTDLLDDRRDSHSIFSL